MFKVKLLVTLAAVTAAPCATTSVASTPSSPSTAVPKTGMTTPTICSLPALPPLPAIQPTVGWEHGVSTGLPSSGAASAYLVMYRDPANTTRFYAFGFDPAGQRNLFVLSVLLTDEASFRNQWTIDVGAWKASHGTAPGEDGITDGIGGTQPPPRPQLDNGMWEHAFYHYTVATQIEQQLSNANGQISEPPPAIPR